MSYRRVLSLIFVAVAPIIAIADSWNPWRDQLVASPNGKYYVVMKRSGGPKVYGESGPVKYIVCQHDADPQPISSARSNVVALDIETYDADQGDQLYEINPNPKVAVRKGDKILGRGNLKRPPREILVSDAGLGFVGLDVYGYNGAFNADNAVIIVSSSGKVTHRKRLIDLFTIGELEYFDTSAGGMWWLDRGLPGWINDATKQLVVVGAASETKRKHHFVRMIDWETGKISKGPIQPSRNAIENLKRANLEGRP